MLFKGIIPIDYLCTLPLHFVHKLRDIRLKQLQEARAEEQREMNKNSNIGNGNFRLPSGIDIGELVDEISP